VAAEGVIIDGDRHERLDRRPDRIYHFGVDPNARMMVQGPPLGRWFMDSTPDCLGATTTTGGWSLPRRTTWSQD